MSGEGACLSAIPGTDADCGIRAAARQGAKARRALDAARGFDIVADPGGRSGAVLICSHKTPEGWRVKLVFDVELDGHDARRIAAEINRYADLIDERVDW